MSMREIARAVLASAVHRLNTVKGGHRIADSRFAAWVCGEGPVIARLRFGAQAIVLANEYVGRAAYLWGDNDPRITAVVGAVLRSGDTVLDIGANFGLPGLFIAKLIGLTGTVHLFEPQPLVASCLRTSLLINGYTTAVVHECALSDRTGSATMTGQNPADMSTATLSSTEPASTDSPHVIHVRIENAGDYMISLGCGKVALIKIDVEGHEAVILASMRDWLAQVRPPIILFECHLEGHAFQEQKAVHILSSLGYEFFSIDTKPYWHTQLNAVTESRHNYGRDFVAVLWQELDEDRRKAFEAMMVSHGQ